MRLLGAGRTSHPVNDEHLHRREIDYAAVLAEEVASFLSTFNEV